MRRVRQKHRHECTEAHACANIVCRHALVTWEAGMVMSPEKHVLLRAKVLEMNSKSLEVGGAEESRILSLGGVQAAPRGLVRQNSHRAAARTPLIAACLEDRPVQAAIPGEGPKRLFFSDGAGAWG